MLRFIWQIVILFVVFVGQLYLTYRLYEDTFSLFFQYFVFFLQQVCLFLQPSPEAAAAVVASWEWTGQTEAGAGRPRGSCRSAGALVTVDLTNSQANMTADCKSDSCTLVLSANTAEDI